MAWVFDEEKVYESDSLTDKQFSALSSPERRRIIKLLSREPSYPAEIGNELEIGKQKAYYHFRKLDKANLIKEIGKEEFSGGVAKIYSPTQEAYHYQVSKEGKDYSPGFVETRTKEFFKPLISDSSMNGYLVVGSPDQHGPDKVRARDGHLAGEIGLVIGRHTKTIDERIKLDTEITRDKLFDENLLLIGGVLTNTVTKKFNENFPVHFSGSEFPYQELEVKDEVLEEPEIGVIQRTENPLNEEKVIYMIAGIRNRGTKAAVLAFKDLENMLEKEPTKDYFVVRGLDIDGDGEIDDYEVVK